ncbi:MAG TPA: hypothetical protein VMH88_08655 [Gemmatimonadales bacterium]|nr:hypothetical protein [Gemmatimonadales bacterium]
MRRRGRLLGAAATVLAAVSPLSGQTAAQYVAQGVKAYQNLDYAAAAGMLRRAFALHASADTLAGTERARAFVYLGASDLFRGRRDSAFAVFRRLVAFNPRFRPDPLIFPPEVTNVFDFAREATKVVVAEYAADTSLNLGSDRYPVHLFASSFHQITVTLNREDGYTVRTLYSGPISDSLDVRWDGTDTVGIVGDTGSYRLTVTSLPSVAGQGQRVLRIRIGFRLLRRDTLPLPAAPPDSLFLPEHVTGNAGTKSLLRGGLVTAGVLVLPSLVANGVGPSGPKAVVAGGIAVASIVGFFVQRPGRPLPDNIAANQAVRDRWSTEHASIARQNADLKRQVRLNLHAGAPSVIGGLP